MTARESMFMCGNITIQKHILIDRITMEDNTEGEVASVWVCLIQPAVQISPLAQQAGGSNIVYITYNTHTALPC